MFEKVDTTYSVGSGFQGYVRAEYKALVAAFGEPEKMSDGKTTVEWTIMFEGNKVASIYDYKEGYTPMSTHNWHVGGKTTEVVSLVNAEVNK